MKRYAVHPRPWIGKTIQKLAGGRFLRRQPSTMPGTNVADYCSAIVMDHFLSGITPTGRPDWRTVPPRQIDCAVRQRR